MGKHSSSEDMIVCMFFTSINRKKLGVQVALYFLHTTHFGSIDMGDTAFRSSSDRGTKEIWHRALLSAPYTASRQPLSLAFFLAAAISSGVRQQRPKRFQLIAHHLKRWFQLQVLAQHFVDVVVQVPDEFGERFPTLVHVVVAFLFHVGQSMGHVFGEIVATMDARQHLTQTKEQSLVPYLSFWSIVEGRTSGACSMSVVPHTDVWKPSPELKSFASNTGWYVSFTYRSMSSDKRFHSWAFPPRRINALIDCRKAVSRFFNRFSVNVNFFHRFGGDHLFLFLHQNRKKATWTKMAGPCIRNDVFIDCCRKKYSPTQNSIMDSVLTNSDVALQFGTMPTGSNKHDIVTQFNEWARDSIEKGARQDNGDGILRKPEPRLQKRFGVSKPVPSMLRHGMDQKKN